MNHSSFLKIRPAIRWTLSKFERLRLTRYVDMRNAFTAMKAGTPVDF